MPFTEKREWKLALLAFTFEIAIILVFLFTILDLFS